MGKTSSIKEKLKDIFKHDSRSHDDLNFTSFGLFEDKVINSELGFGETVVDINKSDHLNCEISMNSQDSFVPWIKQFSKRQEDIIKYDTEDELAADRLKNAAATKKLCIMDAFEIIKKIDEERAMLDGVDIKTTNTPKGFAESRSK